MQRATRTPPRHRPLLALKCCRRWLPFRVWRRASRPFDMSTNMMLHHRLFYLFLFVDFFLSLACACSCCCGTMFLLLAPGGRSTLTWTVDANAPEVVARTANAPEVVTRTANAPEVVTRTAGAAEPTCAANATGNGFQFAAPSSEIPTDGFRFDAPEAAFTRAAVTGPAQLSDSTFQFDAPEAAFTRAAVTGPAQLLDSTFQFDAPRLAFSDGAEQSTGDDQFKPPTANAGTSLLAPSVRAVRTTATERSSLPPAAQVQPAN